MICNLLWMGLQVEAFKFVDVEQNSDEWFSLRGGKLTSSKLGTIMANYGKAFGEPAKKYAVNIAIEQITGNPISSDYSNDHMERGHEQEPVARMLYEQETFCNVTNGGFWGGDDQRAVRAMDRYGWRRCADEMDDALTEVIG